MPATTDRSLATEKRKLREAMRLQRMQVPHAAMLQASQSVARHFADHPILAFAPSFSGYMAMRGEVDVRPVFAQMARFEKETSLPCTQPDKTLLFRRWNVGDALVRSALGVEEPATTAPAVIPAVVLVPLLAFDGDGYRLGYGAGYYDRTMESLRASAAPPLFIGVAYAMQELDQIPTDAHDQPLDGIITELGVSLF
jgi:5-formyltetrahydrofolate cyclo-ligase